MASAPRFSSAPWHLWLLGAGGLALLAAMALRDQNLYAALFADEWHYSAYSRLGPVADSKLPSYLYLWIFRITNQCGDEFLDCARALNAVLFVAALPLIYRVLRAYAPPLTAAALAVVCVAAPVNSYAAYFIAESMYFLLFWLLAVAVLRPYAGRPLAYGLSAGAILGAMCLVKMHAVFLAVGFGAFVIADALWPGRRGRIRPALIVAAASAAAFLAMRFGLGYLLAGANGFDLLGAYYRGQERSNFGLQPLPQLAGNLLFSASGHVLALSLLFAPLLVPALPLLLAPRQDEAAERRHSALLFALAIFAALVAITAYFTASMAGNEVVGRLHLRYYNFCLPLLLITALAWRGPAPGAARQRRALWASALALAGISLFAGAYGLRWFSPEPSDAPELAWVLGRPWLSAAVGVLSAAACLGWVAFKDVSRARLAALGCYVLVVVLGAGAIAASIRHARTISPYIEAGQWLHAQGPQAVARSQVLAADLVGSFKARFYADSLELAVAWVAPGEDAVAKIDWTRDTVVALDGLTVPDGRYARRQVHPGFTVYWLKPQPSEPALPARLSAPQN
ncbi:glycosyltransferase family 39 protein [Lysobacter enzymogenes]|uniref:glycosyltransferase family 39 protein n=1 Tax=Lysobacter enzymogenes TaxID=69 RepID=UPI001A966862|nr:glycosyltransferase family 39 protein [Lysobacter enzymogenes]QQP97252.1 glycosyltransferase family 39 protein [Lysobacter enzymogenes]